METTLNTKKAEILNRINKAVREDGSFSLSTNDDSNIENLAMENLSHSHPSNLYFIRNEKYGVTNWNVVEI